MKKIIAFILALVTLTSLCASVLADGAISACASIRSDYHQGNIYRDSLMDVWNTRFRPYRDREWMRTGECADC